MNELIVFRCQGEGEMYKVWEVPSPNSPFGYYYYVYYGRRKAVSEPFVTLEKAANFCMRKCLNQDTYIEQGGLG